MKLSDLLSEHRILVPLDAHALGDGLRAMLRRVASEFRLDDARVVRAAKDLAFGSEGEVVRLTRDAVAVVSILESLKAPALVLGVAPQDLRVTAEGHSVPGVARIVVLVLSPGRLSGAGQQIVPVLTRVLKKPGVFRGLIEAASAEEVLAIEELMDVEFQAQLLVEQALQPVRYRIYPDTPLVEVVDLMVRRGLRALPVVGESYEVLGIITSGDALGHLLRRGPLDADLEQDEGVPLARDLMTRTVLCVSEDQELAEAANMMVNRDVEQLPVVREGELVGFVTRDSILRALFGEGSSKPDEDQQPAGE